MHICTHTFVSAFYLNKKMELWFLSQRETFNKVRSFFDYFFLWKCSESWLKNPERRKLARNKKNKIVINVALGHSCWCYFQSELFSKAFTLTFSSSCTLRICSKYIWSLLTALPICFSGVLSLSQICTSSKTVTSKAPSSIWAQAPAPSALDSDKRLNLGRGCYCYDYLVP